MTFPTRGSLFTVRSRRREPHVLVLIDLIRGQADLHHRDGLIDANDDDIATGERAIREVRAGRDRAGPALLHAVIAADADLHEDVATLDGLADHAPHDGLRLDAAVRVR